MMYPRTYAMLKKMGHSPVKALEIIISAARGEAHAISWVKNVFSARRGLS